MLGGVRWAMYATPKAPRDRSLAIQHAGCPEPSTPTSVLWAHMTRHLIYDSCGTRQLSEVSGPSVPHPMGAMLSFRLSVVSAGSAEWYVSQSPPSGPATTFWPPGPMT